MTLSVSPADFPGDCVTRYAAFGLRLIEPGRRGVQSRLANLKSLASLTPLLPDRWLANHPEPQLQPRTAEATAKSALDFSTHRRPSLLTHCFADTVRSHPLCFQNRCHMAKGIDPTCLTEVAHEREV